MTKFSVNINKIALLRNQRDIGYPDPVLAAKKIAAAGADGITVHPRPDERHIRRSDVTALVPLFHDGEMDRIAQEANPRRSDPIEFNIEGYPTLDFIELVLQSRPHQVTLVPDAPDQKTSDHGWDCVQHADLLRPIVARFKQAGLRVALFMDPDPDAMMAAKATGTDRVEIYTADYALSYATPRRRESRDRHAAAARAARDLGLGVNAGHDLNLDNLGDLISVAPWIAEVSIGHAFTADALEQGYKATVAAYQNILRSAAPAPR